MSDEGSKILMNQKAFRDNRIIVNAKFEKENFEGHIYKDGSVSIFALFAGKIFINTVFDHCAFKDLDVGGCVFKDCSFDHCTFQGISLTLDTYISRCDFLDKCNFDSVSVFKSVTISHSFFDKENVINNISFENECQVAAFAAKNGYIQMLKDNDSTLMDFALKNFTYTPEYKHYPSDGDFIGWKVIKDAHVHYEENDRLYLVKLLIPKDAKVSSWIGDKCRADRAYVLNIYDQKRGAVQKVTARCAINDKILTTYAVEEYVYPDSFDDNHRNTCSNGIHFFLDKQEAMDYNHFEFLD